VSPWEVYLVGRLEYRGFFSGMGAILVSTVAGVSLLAFIAEGAVEDRKVALRIFRYSAPVAILLGLLALGLPTSEQARRILEARPCCPCPEAP
jgi:hypothetical protein